MAQPNSDVHVSSFGARYSVQHLDDEETDQSSKSQYQSEVDLISANKHRTDAFTAFEYKAGFQLARWGLGIGRLWGHDLGKKWDPVTRFSAPEPKAKQPTLLPYENLDLESKYQAHEQAARAEYKNLKAQEASFLSQGMAIPRELAERKYKARAHLQRLHVSQSSLAKEVANSWDHRMSIGTNPFIRGGYHYSELPRPLGRLGRIGAVTLTLPFVVYYTFRFDWQGWQADKVMIDPRFWASKRAEWSAWYDRIRTVNPNTPASLRHLAPSSAASGHHAGADHGHDAHAAENAAPAAKH